MGFKIYSCPCEWYSVVLVAVQRVSGWDMALFTFLAAAEAGIILLNCQLP